MSESINFKVMDDSAADSDMLKDGTHQRIADRLYDLITKSETKGLTIGLEGSWGSGKSTVVNLLRKKLEDAKETFVFYIDSWVHEGDYLRRAFLESFVEQLQEKGVEKEKIEKIKNEITNKVVVKHNDTSPKTKPLGTALALLTMFLLPIGFSFIDNSCEKLFKDGNFSPNKLFLVGLFLVVIPILFALIVWSFNKKKGLTSVFWTTETTETTTTETTEEPEKTSIEFENFFKRLLKITNEKKWKNIVCVIDNLDRINPDDALKIWSTLQVFVQSKNPNGRCDDQSRVWIIVPYDESGLRLLWDKKENFQNESGGKDSKGNEESKKKKCSKSFFDKNFQLRIEVPKMLFEGWEAFAKTVIDNSLHEFNDVQKSIVLETLKRGREKICDAPSPREIKTYVNQVGFLYDLHKDNASLESLCFYIDLKYLKSMSADDIKNGLLDRRILSENKVLGLVKNKAAIEKELCAILFNVNREKGMELLLEDPVIKALDENDLDELNKLVYNHKQAVKVFVENILAENRSGCINYMHPLMKVFGKDIEEDLLSYIKENCSRICDRIDKIGPIENLCAIFQLVKDYSETDLLIRLSEKYVAKQHENLKSKDEDQKVMDSFERICGIVDDPNLIYLDYGQLGFDIFRQVADVIDVKNMPSFGKFIKNIDSLDDDYSKIIQLNSSALSLLPKFVVHLGCCAGCLHWNSTLTAINNLIVVRPNYNLNTDAFVQCVKLISVIQGYNLKGEFDSIKSLLDKSAFWHYVWISKSDNDVKKIAAYLLAKYYDDLNLPQMQPTGQSPNGFALVKGVFEEKNDDVIEYFCSKMNATEKSDFIWKLAKNSAYHLIGGIVEKQLKDNQHWFFKIDSPFEYFANTIECMGDDDARMRLLKELDSQAQLISYVNTNADIAITNRLRACILLLNSEKSRAVVGKVKKELGQKNKENWMEALDGNTALLDVVCRCKNIEGSSLDVLKNDFSDAFVQYVKSKFVIENSNCLTTEILCNLYDCMNDDFKKDASNGIVNAIIEKRFAVSSEIRVFLITKIDYGMLVDKSKNVSMIIKELVQSVEWNNLEFVVAIIEKIGDKLVPENFYTKVMKQPLESLKKSAEQSQMRIVESLAKFFKVDLNLIENNVKDEGIAS